MAQSKTKSGGRSSKATKKIATSKSEDKRVYFKQSDFPHATLQQALRIASALVDNFAGDAGSPPDVALALGISPTSSGWPTLAGASIAYGLSDGGINANVIKLTALGHRLVAPEAEGEDLIARREAILKPRILREFFEKYRRAKLPNDQIRANVLKSLGLPIDRVESALEIIKANGGYAGIIRETPTGPFINLDSPGVPSPTATPDLTEISNISQDDTIPATHSQLVETQGKASPATVTVDAKANRVFISHGKQRAICRPDQGVTDVRQFRTGHLSRARVNRNTSSRESV